MERNENEWNISNLVWEQHGGNGMESFYDNITIRPLFENKELNIQGYFGSLVKKSLNLISFPPIPPNFGGNENLRF